MSKMKKIRVAFISSCIYIIIVVLGVHYSLYAEDKRQPELNGAKSFTTEIENLFLEMESKFKNSIYIIIGRDEDDAIYIMEWEDSGRPPTDKKFRVLIDELENRLQRTARKNKDRLYSVIISADENVTYGKIRKILTKYEEAVFNIAKIEPQEIGYLLADPLVK